MNMDRGLIIMPAYNESARIGNVLAELPDDIEALVIDDGSTDDLFSVVNNFNVKYIKNAKNSGVSNCTLQGFNYAKTHNYDFVITMDSDGQHDPKYLKYYIDAIGDSSCVLGNRFSNIECIPTSKLCSNSFASVLFKHCFGVSIPDVSCGFRGYSLKEGDINYFDNNNYGYEVVYDLLLKNITSHKGYKIVDIPCIYYPQDLWCTRKQEIISLINAVKRYSSKHILRIIEDRILHFKDFQICLEDITFVFHRIKEKDSYFIQADVAKIVEYYKEFR